MITNKELQDKLKQYPDDAEINIACFDAFGDIELKELCETCIRMDEYGDVLINVT